VAAWFYLVSQIGAGILFAEILMAVIRFIAGLKT